MEQEQDQLTQSLNNELARLENSAEVDYKRYKDRENYSNAKEDRQKMILREKERIR